MSINQESPSELKRAIIRTVAFFDIFDYPLTLVEIHKWLYCQSREKETMLLNEASKQDLIRQNKKYSLSKIYEELESIVLKGDISSKNGFYFLPGRTDIIRTRLYRYQLAEKKFKIALRVTRLFKWLAPVKMVSVCNNVGYNNGTEKSDIDFFIIVKKNRLWLSRFLVTVIATLLGVRRHDQKFIDRICLSFYIAEDQLDLSSISLKPDDIYLVFWLATLAPIYDDGIYQSFFEANKWIFNYLPNHYPALLNGRRCENCVGFFLHPEDIIILFLSGLEM